MNKETMRTCNAEETVKANVKQWPFMQLSPEVSDNSNWNSKIKNFHRRMKKRYPKASSSVKRQIILGFIFNSF